MVYSFGSNGLDGGSTRPMDQRGQRGLNLKFFLERYQRFTSHQTFSCCHAINRH
jgi:hypothetical protein